MTDVQDQRSSWTFLTSHARVLLTIARDPSARMRDMAAACRLTERAVQAVITDLEAGGYLTRVRVGRRNRYEIVTGTMFRHPAEAGQEIAGLLALLRTSVHAPGTQRGAVPEDTDRSSAEGPGDAPDG